LGAAAEGFRTFNTAGAATNDVCRYAIEDDSGAFEIGTIVINSATTGTRTVQISSNSNAELTLTGNAVIFATLSAADFEANPAPIWTTTPPSSVTLATDGSTAVTLAGVAIDEGGYPIRYSWDGFAGASVYSPSSLPSQLASAPTFVGGTASLIGSSTSSNAGTFNFRLRASDGVNTAVTTTAVTLEFPVTIDNVTYDNVSYSLSSQQSGPRSIAFSPDGTKMFCVGDSGDRIDQFSLSTAHSLAPASVAYDNVSFTTSSQEGSPQGLTFSPDGNKLFIVGLSTDRIHQYSLTNPFSLASGNVSYDNVSLATTGESNPRSVFFSTDGMRVFIVGNSSDKVHEYDLAAAFDLTNTTNNTVNFSVSSQENYPHTVAFNHTGKKMFVCGSTSDKVHQYSLTNPFSLASGNVSYDNVSFTTGLSYPCSVRFSGDYAKMYILNYSDDKIYQYSV